MKNFKHFCKIQDKVITLPSGDVCEVCGAEDLLNNRHMQDLSVDDYATMPMDNATAIELGLKTYTPLQPCKRGHTKRFTKSRICIECKKAYDVTYKTLHREKNAKRSAEYREKSGDAYKEKMRLYMRKYRKTDKHKEYISDYKIRKGIIKS